MDHPFIINEQEIVTNNSYLSGTNVLGLVFNSDVERATNSNQHCLRVEHLMHELIPNYSESDKYIALTEIITDVFSNLNDFEKDALRSKLIGHVGVFEDGKPWIDLEAAWMLNLSEEIFKPSTPKHLPKHPPLQEGIKRALFEGRYVPLQHIIHALHIAQFNPDIKEYPLSLTQVVPFNFIEKINRSDVLRGINVHAFLLGMNFPLIGAQFSGVIEKFWNFMFKQRYSAVAGMELYNELLFDFICQLGNGKVGSLDHIPPLLEEKIIAKYKPS